MLDVRHGGRVRRLYSNASAGELGREVGLVSDTGAGAGAVTEPRVPQTPQARRKRTVSESLFPEGMAAIGRPGRQRGARRA